MSAMSVTTTTDGVWFCRPMSAEEEAVIDQMYADHLAVEQAEITRMAHDAPIEAELALDFVMAAEAWRDAR